MSADSRDPSRRSRQPRRSERPRRSVRSQPRRRWAVTLAFVALLALALAGPALASPQPIPVCTTCGERFERYAASGHDLDVTVESSTATVRVHRNGTLSWAVRNRLGANDAETLREAGVADDVAGRAAYFETRALRTTVDDGVVTVRYRLDGFVREAPGGALLVTYFRNDPGVYATTDLGADRVTFVGPENTTVARAPPGARVDGRRVVLEGDDADGDDGFVAFAPDDSAVPAVLGTVAVATALWGIVLRNLLWLVAAPAAATAVTLGLVAWGPLARHVLAPRSDDGSTTDTGAGDVGGWELPALVTAVLGLLLALHPFYVDIQPVIGDYSPLLLGGAVAAVSLVVGATRSPVRDRATTGVLAAAALLALGVGALAVQLAPGIVVPADRALDGGIGEAVGAVLPALPFLLLVPAGNALQGGSPRRRWLVVGALGVVLGVIAGTRWGLLQADWPAYTLLVLFGVGYGVAVPVLGSPLLALGSALGVEPRPT